MQLTEKKCRVADKIMEILAIEDCTVDEAKDILSGVRLEIQRSSTVQIKRRFLDDYKDYFE